VLLGFYGAARSKGRAGLTSCPRFVFAGTSSAPATRSSSSVIVATFNCHRQKPIMAINILRDVPWNRSALCRCYRWRIVSTDVLNLNHRYALHFGSSPTGRPLTLKRIASMTRLRNKPLRRLALWIQPATRSSYPNGIRRKLLGKSRQNCRNVRGLRPSSFSRSGITAESQPSTAS